MRKNKKILIGVWIGALIMFTIFGVIVKVKRDFTNKAEANEKPAIAEEKEEVVLEEFNVFGDNKEYIILIEEGNGTSYKNKYRNKIDIEKPIIKKIVRLEDSAETVKLTEINKELQYLYEEKDIADELRFLNSYNVNLEKENIININEKDYVEFLNKLNIKENEKPLEAILKALKIKENEKYLDIITSKLTKEKKEFLLHSIKNINENNIQLLRSEPLKVENNKVRDMIDEDKRRFVFKTTLEKEITYLDKSVLEKNIYYTGVSEEVKNR